MSSYFNRYGKLVGSRRRRARACCSQPPLRNLMDWRTYRNGVSLILGRRTTRSEEHTSELQSLMRISYAVFCLKKKRATRHTISTQERANSKLQKYRNTN